MVDAGVELGVVEHARGAGGEVESSAEAGRSGRQSGRVEVQDGLTDGADLSCWNDISTCGLVVVAGAAGGVRRGE